ncbi:MAG: cation:proton antiporter [Planctomycetes bacterium]|nr:cation:proton antiporter [Planctomycetota bacterium]
MFEIIRSVVDHLQGLNPILIIGLGMLFAAFLGRIFQRFHIPQIVGYVVMGILLGPVSGIISPEEISHFELFNMLALGLIGFLIGGELKAEIFTKLGKQVFWVLLFEGLSAFLLVGILSYVVMQFFFDGWQTPLAVAVVFAAICAATDPASTVSVLWEYKARGPLTTMLTAVVALDDALALVLYAIGVSVAGVITGHGGEKFIVALGFAFYHILASLAIGLAAGWLLSWILNKIDDAERNLIYSLGFVMLLIGLSMKIHLDVILTSMSLGLVLINTKSRGTKTSFEVMHRFIAPIYVFFFVLVGARLQVANVNFMIIMLVVAYVFGSIFGKTIGSYLGASYSNTTKSVRKYLGFCLYPQGGIAIGLLIVASNRFEPEISSIMLLVVIIGAFVLQIIGPIGVKFGAGKAGELGLNITEEDLIKVYNVSDLMDSGVPVISAGMTLSGVIKVVSDTDSYYYSVVDSENKLIGAITLDGIRNTFATQELNDWLVAMDMMEPVGYMLTEDVGLREAISKMKHLDLEYVPVIDTEDGANFKGVLGSRGVHRQLSAEVLAKQKEADSMYGISAG